MPGIAAAWCPLPASRPVFLEHVYIMKSPIPIALSFLISLNLTAQSVPPLVNYQGKLSNPDGSALPTADYQLSFKVFDSASGSTNLIRARKSSTAHRLSGTAQ